MKYLCLFLISAFALCSCQQQPDAKPVAAYTPGMGELMLNVQIHHAKLWYAGQYHNWPLADYDQQLIRSAFLKMHKYHSEDPAVALVSMIDGPMDSLSRAIRGGDSAGFRHAFELLTTTCNNCHISTNHAFNRIKIPSVEPVGNQIFSLE